MYYPSESAKWREMATTGKFVVGENTIMLNKDQRYKCIHQLAKWGCPYEDLFEAEFARDYSDADERAQISIESIRHREESKDKREIWDSYLVPDKWRKSDFSCSAACFLNQYNRQEGELYADLWFESVEFVEANFHRDYFLDWFNELSPYYLRRQVDLDRMKTLLAKYEHTDKTLFTKLLTEEIEAIEDIMAMDVINH